MGSFKEQDIRDVARDEELPWAAYTGKTVVVTGATGLIGGLVASALAMRNAEFGAGISIVLPVRNTSKAESLLGDLPGIKIIAWDAVDGMVPKLDACDFVIHCAANTDSRLMIERPVDTVLATVEGTKAMLEVARTHEARMCFVSSMEVYGAGDSIPLDESRGGELNAMSVRSSYPQAKQLAETLCAAYAAQYGTEACVARLAQSFGPGIADSDRRVFAEFARCCREGRDIALLTDGSKSNMYVYTADAVRALLTLAAKGVPGEAYNVANEDTFCSIWEMGNLVADAFGSTTRVTRTIDEQAAQRFAVSGSLRLDTSKIRALGWRPTYGLLQMYERMMADWA